MARSSKAIKEPNLWVCCYDLHFPKVDWPTWKGILDFVTQNKANIAGFIFGGDAMDNEEISHHTKGKPLFRPTGSYLRNHQRFEELILNPLEELLPKEATKVYLPGNHGQWAEQLVQVSPELQGLVENHKLLKLEDRGWECIEHGKSYKLGKLNVIHGDELSGWGNQVANFHSKKAVDMYAGSVLYGHFHSLQMYTRILPQSMSHKWAALCSPIAGSTNPGYAKNKPNCWTTGFTVVETYGKGLFNMVPLITVGGMFSYGGVVYGGKKPE